MKIVSLQVFRDRSSAHDQLQGQIEMRTPTFVQVNHTEDSAEILAISVEYFHWMNGEIVRACNFSIPEIVGMTLDQYVHGTVATVCAGVPPEGVFYLMKEGGVTVGSGGLRRLPDGASEIVRIFTRPEFRGRGYGQQMLARLLGDARNLGYDVVKLDTGKFMKSAHRIYESFGFVDCPPYEGAEAPRHLVPYWRYMSRPLD